MMTSPDDIPPQDHPIESVLSGRTGNTAYLFWGLGLLMLKYIVDYAIALFGFGRSWRPSHIFEPSRFYGFWTNDYYGYDDWYFVFTLIMAGLPFLAAGLFLTVRRLNDIGWPKVFALLLFLPMVNVLFFAVLALYPPRPSGQLIRRLPFVGPYRDEPAPAWNNAAVCGLLSAVFSFAMVVLAIRVFEYYGWGLFFVTPFFQGLLAGLLYNNYEPRALGRTCGVAALSLTYTCLGLLVFNIDGLICIMMASPVAVPLTLLGGMFGQAAQLHFRNPHLTAYACAAAWVVMPVALGVEARVMPEPELQAVTSRVAVGASAEDVWELVVAFPDLPPPREALFKTGIAYPLRATIEGTGVGAVRYCEFSTGPFVEPITTWDPPRHLAFDVTEQPEPLREVSLYAAQIHPPHLENHILDCRRGEFRIIESADGVILEGTTWYTNHMWPETYWTLWTDWIIHRIHMQVLGHIKGIAEG